MAATTASLPLVGPGSAQRLALAAVRGREFMRDRAAVMERNRQLSQLPQFAHIAENAYKPNVTDVLLGRYRVQQLLGYGSFGSVVRAQDVLTGDLVAVKLLHRVRGLHRDVLHEARMYETLLAGCSSRISLFVEVLGVGNHGGFHCTVFELCEATLSDVLRGTGDLLPLPTKHIREIALQVVLGVEYLHALGFVHGDIKPDNIAFKNFHILPVQELHASGRFYQKKILASTALRIIDLGSTMRVAQISASPAVVGAKQYRAPEVDLRMGLSCGIDTFAVGCVIAEVYLSESLFHPDVGSDLEHLAMVDRIVGPFPRDFAQAIERAKPGTFRFTPKIEVVYPPLTTTLPRQVIANAIHRLRSSKHIFARIHDTILSDLVKRLLAPDPSRRMSLSAAARHLYFDEVLNNPRAYV